MQDDLFQTAISSQQDIPASHSPLPGSSEAQKMTAISGRKYLPLCKQSDQLGAFSRMFLATLPWASTRCYLTWKVKATPFSRLLFQLAPLMPRTDETGSGLLHTPTAKANQMAPDMLKRGSGWWPTPEASDRGPRSADLVVNQSTVQRRDSGQKRGMDLQTAAKMGPTPAANKITNSGELVNANGEPWDGVSKPHSKKTGKQVQTALTDAVRMWPTPTANEDAAGTPNGKMQRQLGNHPDIRGTTPEEWKRGSLNPQWVEWLMGYPEGWTDLKG